MPGLRHRKGKDANGVAAAVDPQTLPLKVVPATHVRVVLPTVETSWLRKVGTVLGFAFLLFSAVVALSLVLVANDNFADTLTFWTGLGKPRRIGSNAGEVVLFQERSVHQDIIVTKWEDEVTLYIDRLAQFNSKEEHRYHEALVHPAMSLAYQRRGGVVPKRVLLLGAGDGLAARELLLHDDEQKSMHIDLVDIDNKITNLCGHPELGVPDLIALTRGSLSDPRVHLIHEDAAQYVVDQAQQGKPAYDVIVIDLPDPVNTVLSDLYSVQFYVNVLAVLAPQGVVVTQATGPLSTSQTFWSIWASLGAATEASAAKMQPPVKSWTKVYTTYVPSWSEWGFVIAARGVPAPEKYKWPLRKGLPYKYLNDDAVQGLFAMAEDILVRDNNETSKPQVNHHGSGVASSTFHKQFKPLAS